MLIPPPLQLSHTQGLFLRLDLFYPSLYCVCMSALHRGSMSMTVKDYGGKWGSPNPPSSQCSEAVIPQGIAGRAIETHYCWNHIASEGCKLPGKWMEHTRGGRGWRRGWGSASLQFALTHVISFWFSGCVKYEKTTWLNSASAGFWC